MFSRIDIDLSAASRFFPALILWLAIAVGSLVAYADQGEFTRQPQLILEPGAHTGPIRQIAVDHRQKRLVTVSDDKSARVWDLPSNQLIGTLRPPAGADQVGRLYGVAISRDGIIAIGGTTAAPGGNHRIYLYDLASLGFLRAIDARGGDVKRLAWSPDGKWLAASFAESPALRIFTPDGAMSHEELLPADAWSVAFSSTGTLAVPVSNGTIRFYTFAGGTVVSTGEVKTGRQDPRGIDFSPDGTLLAVGFNSRQSRETIRVDIVNVEKRSIFKSLTFDGFGAGNLRNTAWSRDGAQIYFGGSAATGADQFVVKQISWPSLQSTEFVAASNSVTDLLALNDGRLVIATAEPAWAVVAGSGLTRLSANIAAFSDTRSMRANETVSAVSFRFRQANALASFDLITRRFDDPDVTSALASVKSSISAAIVSDWENNLRPKIGGTPVKLDTTEVARTAVVLPRAGGVVIGTSRALRRFNLHGEPIWSVRLSTEVRTTAVSTDGNVMVMGMADGTIRWRRTSDGAMLMSFFSTGDRKWVLWTESGYFDVSAGAEDLIGWLVNRHDGDQADFFAISRFRDRYYRPDVIDQVLVNMDAGRALEAANDLRRKAALTLAEPVRSRVEQFISIAPLTQSLPPIVTLVSPSIVETATADITMNYRVFAANGEVVSGFEVRVDGRPYQKYRNEMPATTDGKSVGRLHISLPPRNVLVQIFVTNTRGISSPAVAAVEYAVVPTDIPTIAAVAPALVMPVQPPVQVVQAAPSAAPVPAQTASAVKPSVPPVTKPQQAAMPVAPTVAPAAKQPTPTPTPGPAAVPAQPPVILDKRPTLFLLAIGVSEYAKNEYDLAFAAKDARDLSGVFNAQSGLLYKKVEMRVLSNKLATSRSILEGLTWLKATPTADDVAVLFLAGHGLNDIDDTYYFAPHDVDVARLAETGVPEQHFRDALANIRGKTLFFVDTCFSGRSVGTFKQSDLTKLANKLSSPENGVIVFSASHGRQASLEEPSWQNGAFTKALVAGLVGEADYRKEGLVTHRGLDYYVGYEVKKLTNNQQQPVTMVPVGLPDFGITKPKPLSPLP